MSAYLTQGQALSLRDLILEHPDVNTMQIETGNLGYDEIEVRIYAPSGKHSYKVSTYGLLTKEGTEACCDCGKQVPISTLGIGRCPECVGKWVAR